MPQDWLKSPRESLLQVESFKSLQTLHFFPYYLYYTLILNLKLFLILCILAFRQGHPSILLLL